MALRYQKPTEGEMLYACNYYRITEHFGERYRQRMAEHIKSPLAKKRLLEVDNEELERRANYMLLFSIHGRDGDTPQTEVRYYFNWNIVVDNKNKTIVTMYIDESRSVPPVRLFGDRKMRKLIYKLWFKPNSKIHQVIH